ncbi:MAG TPA: copper chaperone PCu(A)C [Colwellia sp.]|nr:copper chaperone PCu(A)C [Colwellia sp.]
MKNIHYRKIFIIFMLLIGMITNVYAMTDITVSEGYIKASIPGSSITAAYMTISNAGNKAITLQKISSTISDRIEIHEHSMSDGMMRMRQVTEITIDANNEVVLQPSGLHLMIFSLKQKVTDKDVIPLTLYFSNKTKINIQLPVYRYK